MTDSGGRGYALAAVGVVAFFVVAYAWLHDAPFLLTQAGTQSVLASDSLVRGLGLELEPGVPFSKYPPLYPLLLAPLEACGLGVGPALYAVNCATLAITLFAMYALARQLGVRWAWLAPVLYASLGATHYLLRTARADAIPICACLVAVLALARYARDGSRGALAVSVVACALGGLSRYMAMVTLVPILLGAVVWLAGPARRSRIRDGLAFALGAGLPSALWLARNVVLKGQPFGISKVMEARSGAEGTTFLTNVSGLVKTFFIDLFGHDALGVRIVTYGETRLPHPTALYAGIAVAGGCWIALAWSGRRARRSTEEPERASCRIGTLLAVFFALYAAAMIAIWTIGQNDPIHTRYVAPLYAPLCLLALAAGQRVLRASPTAWKRAAMAAIALAVVVPNAAKSARILGDAPHERLLEITSRRGTNRWHAAIPWDLFEERADGTRVFVDPNLEPATRLRAREEPDAP